MTVPPGILQIGFGNFGPTHLNAWRSLGMANRLHIVDPSPAARAACIELGMPAERVAGDAVDFLDRVGIVDVVAPTDLHRGICAPLLESGKHLFIEKPMTTTVVDAEDLAAVAARHENVVQVGFYFRGHPLAGAVKAAVDAGQLGDLRYIAGRFHGYKRARADSGVVQNDAVHFIDQANWMAGSLPVEVDAVTRDHFGRGFDDFALIRMFYASGLIASIEVGCIQPGRWNDDIVPGATQTKEFTVAGSLGGAEIDYQTFELTFHKVRHELDGGLWRPVGEGSEKPHVERVEPWQVVAGELRAFMASVETGSPVMAPMDDCGIGIARIFEAVYRSSETGRRAAL
jgi:predicted dehydrogenase